MFYVFLSVGCCRLCFRVCVFIVSCLFSLCLFASGCLVCCWLVLFFSFLVTCMLLASCMSVACFFLLVDFCWVCAWCVCSVLILVVRGLLLVFNLCFVYVVFVCCLCCVCFVLDGLLANSQFRAFCLVSCCLFGGFWLLASLHACSLFLFLLVGSWVFVRMVVACLLLPCCTYFAQCLPLVCLLVCVLLLFVACCVLVCCLLDASVLLAYCLFFARFVIDCCLLVS